MCIGLKRCSCRLVIAVSNFVTLSCQHLFSTHFQFIKTSRYLLEISAECKKCKYRNITKEVLGHNTWVYVYGKWVTVSSYNPKLMLPFPAS